MNCQRYQPVVQRDETISLDSIHGSPPSYSYNPGLASSLASSRYEPSVLAPSIPNSPPPSFHTHSSPGTPRPTPSTTTHASTAGAQSSYVASYADLYGVAPSTASGETSSHAIDTSNDALATITGLQQRIEWLEESVGRLLVEKVANANAANANGEQRDGKGKRVNCCVTFTDASPDLERALTAGKGTNCCVRFRSRNAHVSRTRARAPLLSVLVLFMVCVTTVLVAEAGSKTPRAFALESDDVLK